MEVYTSFGGGEPHPIAVKGQYSVSIGVVRDCHI